MKINYLLIISLFCLLSQCLVAQDCYNPCDAQAAPSDNCIDAPLVNMSETICGTTVGYSRTFSGDLEEEFCGGLHNNSFFKFIAPASEMDIYWWVVSGTFCDRGLQFHVLDVDDPCDYEFADWRTIYCLSPTGPPGSEGVVQLTNLEPGKIYYFMIDGFAGDLCEYEFNVKVERGDLVAFNGDVYDTGVNLFWVLPDTSALESVTLTHSLTANNFDELITLPVNQGQTLYTYLHTGAVDGYNYYRLELIDTTGFNLCSDIVDILYGPPRFDFVRVYPIPAREFVYVEFTLAVTQNISIQIFDVAGRQLRTVFRRGNSGLNYAKIDIEPFPIGTYLVTIDNGFNGITHKFIKY